MSPFSDRFRPGAARVRRQLGRVGPLRAFVREPYRDAGLAVRRLLGDFRAHRTSFLISSVVLLTDPKSDSVNKIRSRAARNFESIAAELRSIRISRRLRGAPAPPSGRLLRA